MPGNEKNGRNRSESARFYSSAKWETFNITDIAGTTKDTGGMSFFKRDVNSSIQASRPWQAKGELAFHVLFRSCGSIALPVPDTGRLIRKA